MADQGKPIRVAFCTTDLEPGGAERALVQLVVRLDRDRWDPIVFSLSGPGTLVEILSAAGIPVVCLGARHWLEVWKVWRLARQLRAWQPQLLQTFLFHANIAGRLAGRLAGVKTIVSGIRVAEKGVGWHVWLDRLTNGMVDHNVCVSQSVARFSIDRGGLKPEKVSVIPNGIDVEEFRSAPIADLSQFGIPPDASILLCIGRLAQQKGQAVLIDAARLLMPSHEALHVLFVGCGPMEQSLRMRASQTSHGDRFHFAGWRNDVPELLAACECVVVPSLWEGMANVVLEAMAAGKPVVASRVEGMQELVQHERTGILVEPGSAKELSEAIAKLLGDPKRAAEMGNQSQDVASQMLTWQSVNAGYDGLYRSLLSK